LWGYLFKLLLEMTAPARLIGVDVAAPWGRVGSLWDWEGDGRVDLRQTDIFGLELAPGSVDLVLCSGMLMYLSPEALDATLSRVYDLLRPGGQFLLRTQVYTSYLGASLHRSYANPYVHLFHGERLLQDRLREHGGRVNQYTNWLTPTSYLIAFTRAGFEILDAVRLKNWHAPSVQAEVAAEFPVDDNELNVTGLEAQLVRPFTDGDIASLLPHQPPSPDRHPSAQEESSPGPEPPRAPKPSRPPSSPATYATPRWSGRYSMAMLAG
jgi:SAM-dependent methyltransferase